MAVHLGCMVVALQFCHKDFAGAFPPKHQQETDDIDTTLKQCRLSSSVPKTLSSSERARCIGRGRQGTGETNNKKGVGLKK